VGRLKLFIVKARARREAQARPLPEVVVFQPPLSGRLSRLSDSRSHAPVVQPAQGMVRPSPAEISFDDDDDVYL
jgi:hypothetical protein